MLFYLLIQIIIIKYALEDIHVSAKIGMGMRPDYPENYFMF